MPFLPVPAFAGSATIGGCTPSAGNEELALTDSRIHDRVMVVRA